MFGAAVAYDEVKYKYTDLQSLVASCFATGQVLHKAYDEIKDFCRLLSHSLPIASLLSECCIKPTTKSETELITMMQSLVPNSFAVGQTLCKAYDEVRDLFITLMQSLASNRFALGRVLHKAYDEIRDIYI